MSALNLTACRVAIAGQPNTGKSTVFNTLTGLYQEVGNWAGKTAEKKSGRAPEKQGGYTVIDLPGSYTLSANSEEERIAVDYLMRENPELTVVVANAASPERTLSYALDLALLQKPMIVALNMADVAAKSGICPAVESLAEALGIPVLLLSATKKKDIPALQKAIGEALRNGSRATPPLERLMSGLYDALADKNLAKSMALAADAISTQAARTRPESMALLWYALEGRVESRQQLIGLAEKMPELKKLLESDVSTSLAQARYAWLEDATGMDSAAALQKSNRTARTDRWLLHPLWGSVAMLGIILAAVVIGFGLGFPLTYQVGMLFRDLLPLVSGLVPESSPLVSALLTGTWKGVGAVLSMLPFILAFYAVFAFLEDIGYMARAAFIMDRAMSKIGLNGKTFIPLLFAVPCNITGVIGARTVDDPRQRLLTFLLIPLVPCTAKLIVLSTLSIWLFPPSLAPLVVLGLVGLNAAVLGACSLIFGRFIPQNNDVPGLLMELPHYHRPNLRTITRYVIRSAMGFLKKAATLIVAFSVLIWFLSYYPSGDIQTSLLGSFGKAISPLGEMMGVDWRVLTALLSSAVSREAVMATLGVLFGAGPDELPAALNSALSPAGAVAFMCAQSLFIPCIATIGILFSETRSWRILGVISGYTVFLPFIVAILVYQVLNLFI